MAAIYMWFQIYEEEYTTTLYSLESDDGVLISADIIDDGYLAPIDFDQIQQGHQLDDVVVRQLLLSAPEQTDSIQQGHQLDDLIVRQLLLSAPEQNDSITQGHELDDLVVRTILITTYMPDRGMLIGADLVPGSCYMTAV